MTRISRLLSGAVRFVVFWVNPRQVWRLRADFDAQNRKMQSLVYASDHMFAELNQERIDNEVLPLATSVTEEAGEEKVFRKVFRHPKGTGITAKQAFFLELECLARINQALVTQDSLRHFPRLHGFNVDDLALDMSWDGVSLDNLTSPQIIPDAEGQIENIVATLQRADICHLDIHESGKNLLVDSRGRLTLIDFNRAVIRNTPVNPLVGRKLPAASKQAQFHRARLRRCLDKNPLITPG